MEVKYRQNVRPPRNLSVCGNCLHECSLTLFVTQTLRSSRSVYFNHRWQPKPREGDSRRWSR